MEYGKQSLNYKETDISFDLNAFTSQVISVERSLSGVTWLS